MYLRLPTLPAIVPCLPVLLVAMAGCQAPASESDPASADRTPPFEQLVRTCSVDSDPALRARAAAALAAWGSVGVGALFDALVGPLPATETEFCSRHVRILAALRRAASVFDLDQVLCDAERAPAAHLAAVVLLGERGAAARGALPSIHGFLQASTSDLEVTVAARAIDRIGGGGTALGDLLVRRLQGAGTSGSPNQHVALIRALGACRQTDAQRTLLGALVAHGHFAGGASVAPAVAAVEALARGLDPRALPILASQLGCGGKVIQRAVLRALAAFSSAPMPLVRRVAGALAHGDDEVRYFAVRAVARLGAVHPRRTAQLLAPCLGDPVAANRAAVAVALRCCGAPGRAAVCAALGTVAAAPDTWRGAMEAVRSLGPAAAPAVDALVGYLRDGDAAQRHHAALALAAIGAPSAAPLVDLLGGTVCAELRDRAAAVLAQLGEVAAPPLLRGLVASADPIATGALLECVARLGARAVPDLFDFLASGAPPADKCVCLRAAARLARGDAAGRASLRRGARVLRGLCADAFLRPWAEGVLQCVAAAECAVSPHRSLDLPSRAAVVADAR